MQTADFDYDLPPEQIAIAPSERRDEARLLVMDRRGDERKHVRFHELGRFLPARSLLVLNDVRVLPARLRGRKPTGGAVEFLLTRRVSKSSAAPDRFAEEWEALTRGLSKVDSVEVGGGVTARIVERREAGRALVHLQGLGPSLEAALESIGEVPIPPYIESARRRAGGGLPPVDDRARYQTVYARRAGAVAAPTAGLHFTPAMLEALRAAGHELAFVTLDVGPGTFRPVETDDPRAHQLEPERYEIPAATATAIETARRARRPIVAIGTTVVRTLEASARGHGGTVAAEQGETDLFLYPGAEFQVVTDLLTNFHLPRSTLLMLAAAFAGRDRILAAYREAVGKGYRFYSYGDAMLIRGSAS